jgi:hypothetical protein
MEEDVLSSWQFNEAESFVRQFLDRTFWHSHVRS